jgi:lipopolysaccharide/colanic/teichoic acid biosynthesis glycosyltransferase
MERQRSLYGRGWPHYCAMRPGITGLWQVEGRSKTSFDDMVRLDLRYVRYCSLTLDVKILFKTLVVVLKREGAT